MLLSCRPQGLQLNFYPERSRHMEIFIKITDGGLFLDTTLPYRTPKRIGTKI